MLIMGMPQFDVQDDLGNGTGIPPPPEWQLDFTIAILQEDLPQIFGVSETDVENINLEVRHVFIRLHNLFRRAQTNHISSTVLHDLTCYVVHRLLLLHADTTAASNAHTHNSDQTPAPLLSSITTTLPTLTPPTSIASIQPGPFLEDPSQPILNYPSCCPSAISECIRYGIVLYMFITQGSTYFSHNVVLNTLTGKFMEPLKQLFSEGSPPPSSSFAATAKDATVIHVAVDELDYPCSNFFTRQQILRDPLDIWLVSIGLVSATGTPHYTWFVEQGTQAALLLLHNTCMHVSENSTSSSSIDGTRKHLTWAGDILPRTKRVLWLEKPKAEDVFRPHWEGILGAVQAIRLQGGVIE